MLTSPLAPQNGGGGVPTPGDSHPVCSGWGLARAFLRLSVDFHIEAWGSQATDSGAQSQELPGSAEATRTPVHGPQEGQSPRVCPPIPDPHHPCRSDCPPHSLASQFSGRGSGVAFGPCALRGWGLGGCLEAGAVHAPEKTAQVSHTALILARQLRGRGPGPGGSWAEGQFWWGTSVSH